MLASHATVYGKLDQTQVRHLWQRLIDKKMIRKAIPAEPNAYTLLQYIDGFTHGEIVMALADDPSPMAMDVAGILIEKPIYQCAIGETGEALTDIHGRPLVYPLGHRRGESAPTMCAPAAIRVRTNNYQKQDNRIISGIQPNPKDPARAAYARYAQYVEGQTVRWHLANTDIRMEDIRWDASKGFIQLNRPGA